MPNLDVRLIFIIYQSVLVHNISQEPECQKEGEWIHSESLLLTSCTNRSLLIHSFFSVLITELFEHKHVYSRKMRQPSKKPLWMLSKNVRFGLYVGAWEFGINGLSHAKGGEEVVKGPPSVGCRYATWTGLHIDRTVNSTIITPPTNTRRSSAHLLFNVKPHGHYFPCCRISFESGSKWRWDTIRTFTYLLFGWITAAHGEKELERLESSTRFNTLRHDSTLWGLNTSTPITHHPRRPRVIFVLSDTMSEVQTSITYTPNCRSSSMRTLPVATLTF